MKLICGIYTLQWSLFEQLKAVAFLFLDFENLFNIIIIIIITFKCLKTC